MADDSPKKKHGFLKFLIILLIIAAIIFIIVKVVQFQDTKQTVGTEDVFMGNHDGDTKLLHRSARTDDIVVDTDLDLASLGEKFIILPQTDIEDLEITINFLDGDKKFLDSYVKTLGNVKSGVQVSFSISLFDLGLSVAWNTKYSSVIVTGGTVSYFS